MLLVRKTSIYVQGDIRLGRVRREVHGVDLQDVVAGIGAVGQRVVSVDREVLVVRRYRRLVEEGQRPSKGRKRSNEQKGGGC